MELSVKQIADLLGGRVQGDGSIKIKKLDTLQDASKGSISFLSNPFFEINPIIKNHAYLLEILLVTNIGSLRYQPFIFQDLFNR